MHLIYLSEQYQDKKLEELYSGSLHGILTSEVYGKPFFHNAEQWCFQFQRQEHSYLVNSSYFVGVDWLVPKIAAIYIESKLNNTAQIDVLGMLIASLEATENLQHLNGLFHVDYDQEWISIPHSKDLLSPILIVQFLRLVQQIVRKGLKKSYYRVTANLNSRVKGKILVGQQIKENIVKNKKTSTLCDYQEYGVNTEENQYLKSVLEFVSSYLAQKQHFFTAQQNMQLQNILYYCMPAFEQVDLVKTTQRKPYLKKNVFYNDYEEALKIGEYILKRFSFNINKISQSQSLTPPFWIDMSKLFELYVFQKLKDIFPQPNGVTYHDTFQGGKETDILLRVGEYKCVIDCKYKPRYKDQPISLEDKRQLAGYTRLKAVYEKLAIPYNQIIRGLIIYPDQSSKDSIEKNSLFEVEIGEYLEFYKSGIQLPYILDLKQTVFDNIIK